MTSGSKLILTDETTSFHQRAFKKNGSRFSEYALICERMDSSALTMPTAEQLENAAVILRAGGLVGMPTETVYGLAGDATSDIACARIFEAKRRPKFNPLIAHMADLGMARDFVEFNPLALVFARNFWPGPLTLVLPRRLDGGLSSLANAGLATQAVRVPAHQAAQALISKLARPIAAPSANMSGRLSPTTASHVRESLGKEVPVLDAGPTKIGLESTVLKIDSDERATLLRPGAIPLEDLQALAAIDPLPVDIPDATDEILSPGMLESHYAPKANLALNIADATGYDVHLGFHTCFRAAAGDLNLSESGCLTEAAANFFSYLHQLDRISRTIAVAPIPQIGIGQAINDRLRRAASARQ